MSTIELDPALILALDETEWRLLALAGETPAVIEILPAPSRFHAAVAAADALLPVACFAPEAGDAGPRAFACVRPTVCPPAGELERERALGSAFQID